MNVFVLMIVFAFLSFTNNHFMIRYFDLKMFVRFILCSGRMLPLRPPAGKPAPLVCTYAATGHNSAVLSLDVTEDLMFTGSKGEFAIFLF